MKSVFLLLLCISLQNVYASDTFGISKLNNEKLLKLYWECDKIASLSDRTGETIERESMAICSSASAELRKRFFNDDFITYMEWVGNNKDRVIKLYPG